jgi:hypothetical protein
MEAAGIANTIYIAMYLLYIQEIYPFVKDSIIEICVQESVRLCTSF